MSEPMDRARSATTFGQLYDPDTWELLDTGAYAWVGKIRRAPAPDLTTDDADEVVVLKIFRWDDERHQRLNVPRRIQAEARHARILSPYVLPIDGCYFADGLAWLEMPYVDGKGMHQIYDFDAARRNSGKAVSHDQLCAYAHALFSGIRDAHAAGIVHRDIKPQNLLVLDHPPPPLMILDFGIAKTLTDAKITSTTWPGTPWYAPHETYRGLKPGMPGDVWSGALVLYELACGSHPWDVKEVAEQTGEAITARLSVTRLGHAGPPTPPRYFRPDLDEVLAQLLIDCLAFEPDERPTAQQVLERLAALGVGDARPAPSLPASPPRGNTLPPAKRSKRGLVTLILALGLTGVVALVGLTAWLVAGSSPRVHPLSRTEPTPAIVSEPPAPEPTPPLFDVLAGPGYLAVGLAPGIAEASDLELTLITKSGDVHTATIDRLEPRLATYLWAARWTPALPQGTEVERLEIDASVGQQRVHTRHLEAGSDPGGPPRNPQRVGAGENP